MAIASLGSVNFAATDAQKMILIFMVIMVVAVTIEKLANKSGATITGGYVDIFVATFIITLILEGLSYILPEFAVGIAGVAVITVIFTKGEVFWGAVSTAVKNPTGTPTPTPTPTGPETLNPQGGTEPGGASVPYGPPVPQS